MSKSTSDNSGYMFNAVEKTYPRNNPPEEKNGFGLTESEMRIVHRLIRRIGIWLTIEKIVWCIVLSAIAIGALFIGGAALFGMIGEMF